jgi:hypothetical protein
MCILLISLINNQNVVNNNVLENQSIEDFSTNNPIVGFPCQECSTTKSISTFRLIKEKFFSKNIDESIIKTSSKNDAKYRRVYPIDEIPKEWNWNKVNGRDYVPPTQSQGECGSCWAFSAIRSMQAVLEIESDRPDWNPDLSEQDVLSCSGAGTCDGGNTGSAISWLKTNGVVTEECWPYTATRIPCPLKPIPCKFDVTKIADYGEVPASMTEMKQAIWEHGPITATVRNYNGNYHAINLWGFNEYGTLPTSSIVASHKLYWMEAGLDPYYSLFLDYPLGGEVFDKGDILTIAWTANDFVGNVEIRYSTDGGETFPTQIANVSVTVGSYDWAVPDINSNNVVIQINGISPDNEYLYIPYDESGTFRIGNDDDDDDNPGFFELLLKLIIEFFKWIFKK